MELKEVKSLGKYLGFPLNRCKKPSMAKLSCIIEKVQQKLDGWKARQLSMVRRVESILEAIPTYYMQVASLPSKFTTEH